MTGLGMRRKVVAEPSGRGMMANASSTRTAPRGHSFGASVAVAFQRDVAAMLSQHVVRVGGEMVLGESGC